MPLTRHLQFWLLAFIAFFVFLYVFRDILFPFVTGIAIAFFLDPVADRLEKMGCSRLWAVFIILGSFLVLVLLLFLTIVPLIGQQFAEFFTWIPEALNELRVWLSKTIPAEVHERLRDSGAEIAQALKSASSSMFDWIGSFIKSVINTSGLLFSAVSLLFIMPVVAFYMLLDWDGVVAKMNGYLPRRQAPVIRQLLAEINATLAAFFRGQFLIMIYLAAIYGTGLSLIGLQFGLVVGLIAGLISFIPYFGSISGLVLALAIAIWQFWGGEWIWILAVAALFGAGQFIEGNILQPKLLGKAIQLHPVWLMFALMAGGLLMGFTGLILAVPVAAVIGVLVRFALGQYLQSSFYLNERDG